MFNMKRKCLLWMVLLLMVNMVFAQRTTSSSHSQRFRNKKVFSKIMTAYSDSLANVVDKYSRDSTYFRVSLNPYYYRLFAPVTLYNSVVSNAMSMDNEAEVSAMDNLIPINNKGVIETDEEINSSIDNALMNIYLNEPLSVRYTENDIMGRSAFKKDVVRKWPRRERVTDLLGDTRIVDPTVNTELVIKKPNFWKKAGNAYLQFTQNYISGNWYKGGESNNTLLSGLVLESNYNDRQKIQWDNKLEWKLGFLSSRSDTLHKYKTNTDLIRLTSKLGLQAIKNWYYTIQAEFYTQFFASYKSNKPDVVSSFLSPGYLKIDLGMDYKRSTKTFEVSAVLAPLSYKLTYVRDDKVDETKFSVDEDKKFKNDLGSNLQIISAWKIIPQVKWESRISYFTTYEKSQAEWENTFNFSLNRYLTTKLFVHARYDDGVKKKEDYDYFQLMELLSFGLSYNW